MLSQHARKLWLTWNVLQDGARTAAQVHHDAGDLIRIHSRSTCAPYEDAHPAHGCGLENPLCFTFPPDVDEESLMTGAEQLSEAVLSSGKGGDATRG
jgi:hypothetical protein